jgi:pilus assembly protein FimV
LKRLLPLALVAIVAAPTAATAQNLGRLGLLSNLGEPLDAQIEIVAPPEARTSLAASIVPIGVYERFGVTPSPPPDVLRAAVEQGADGRPVVRLRSTVPVQRPAVEVIVELAWNGGRMVRQYSFTVDPPAVARAEPAPAPKPEPASAPAAEGTPPAPKPAAVPKPALKPASKPAAKPQTQTAEKAERPRAAAPAAKPRKDAGPTDREIAAAQDRVKNLERTMNELQQQIDARNREIEALQRQVGGAAK